MNLPPVASRETWLEARKALLLREKELNRTRDALNAARRQLPMVQIEKDYSFEGPDGPRRLVDLFEGRKQLIVYHFMFDPSWEDGCSGCTFLADNLAGISHLHERDTTLAFVSRAPQEKISGYKARRGWNVPWYSSYGSDFNYDFHATLDRSLGAVEYNYKPAEDPNGEWDGSSTEVPGVSVFLRDGEDVFHTYSTYARGADLLLSAYNYLDLTPLGRQEEFEERWNREAAAERDAAPVG